MPPIFMRLHYTDPQSRFHQRELACRKHYQDDAAKGDPAARLMLRSFYHLTGWYNREKGRDVIGELSKVARERETK